ncbi:MAG: hypothetical protein JW837_09305 [Sedimentisphaerales bacterium]|nr:hypothetical protein [Sedimentisphaerales bacterium]
MKKNLEKIAAEDGRYHPKGVMFVYDGLGHTLKNYTSEPQHVTGQTLCDGLKELALKRWGRLSKLVLNNWNIKSTRDFGEIVYMMIEHEWMSAQPSDTIEDFNDVFDFDQAFKSKL